MENSLKIFENEEFGEIRTVIIDGEIYFVGKDIAVALGYTNPQKAIRDHVEAEDKRAERIVHPLGGEQDTLVINESGLYSLVLSSNLPNAKKFKRWVTSEVLPSIRKRGVYATDDFIKQAISNPKWAIDVLTAYQEEKDKNAVLTQQVNELQPKAEYYDLILNCKDLISTTTVAKDYGMSATAMNQLLRKLGIQFKQGDIWLLYQKYAKLGWTSTKTHEYLGNDGNNHSKVHTYWTQKGRLAIYNLLKAKNILPIIEQN